MGMNEFIRTPRFLRNFFITFINLVKIQGAVVRPKGILLNIHMVPSIQKQKYFLKRVEILAAHEGSCSSLVVSSKCSILVPGVSTKEFISDRSIIGRTSTISLGTVNRRLTWTASGISWISRVAMPSLSQISRKGFKRGIFLSEVLKQLGIPSGNIMDPFFQ